jgi:hypothetical protein
MVGGAVVEVGVVEVEALVVDRGVLEDVAAGAALVEDEGAGLALDEVLALEPHAEVARPAQRAVVPSGLEEPVDAAGQ